MSRADDAKREYDLTRHRAEQALREVIRDEIGDDFPALTDRLVDACLSRIGASKLHRYEYAVRTARHGITPVAYVSSAERLIASDKSYRDGQIIRRRMAGDWETLDFEPPTPAEDDVITRMERGLG